MQKLCCVRTRQHLCQFGLFRHNFTTVSPPILNHFWWELYQIEIKFVKSAENDSDIMTKNQQGQHYMYAKSKLVYTVQEMSKKRDIQDEETERMLES